MTSVGDSHPLSNTPLHLPHLIDSLPYDIRCEIFSNLTQSECLECMAVCRAWNVSLSQYAASLWQTLDTPLDSFDVNNKRILQCLGSHLNRLVLRDDDGRHEKKLLAILQILAARKCHYIRSIELHTCRITDQEAFLNALKPVTYNLSELTLNKHIQNLAFLHIFNTCPNLTHFNYTSVSRGDQWRTYPAEEPVKHHTLALNIQFPNITSLYLNAVISNDRLVCILRRCPNIRCLLVSNVIQDADHLIWPSNNIIDIDKVLELCPELEYFECYAYEPEYQARYQSTAKDHSGNRNRGLRYFVTREAEGNGPEEIMSVITKHQKSLEVLWIGKRIGYDSIPPITYGEEWNILGSIHATRLMTLTFNGIQCYGQTLAALISQCPALENVMLWGTLKISQDVMDALGALQRLTQLDLYISNRYALDDSTDLVGFCRAAPKTIRRLCLRGAGSTGFVTNELLHSIAKHMGSSLRELVLDTSLNNNVKDMAWFFQQLKQLECLELDGVMCLSQPAFESLSRLQQLKAVRLYLCQSVTHEALDVLISQSPNLRRLGVVYCNLGDPERFLRDAQKIINHVYVKG